MGPLGKGEIWIFAPDSEARNTAKTLETGTLINQIRIISPDSEFGAAFAGKPVTPLLVLVDLSDDAAWNIISAIRSSDREERVAMIALVDNSTECLIDKAYDAGVKTYLRKPLDFSDFVLRAKLLNMNVSIERPGANT
jgi:AmiR/NasT family two-component response regulator